MGSKTATALGTVKEMTMAMVINMVGVVEFSAVLYPISAATGFNTRRHCPDHSHVRTLGSTWWHVPRLNVDGIPVAILLALICLLVRSHCVVTSENIAEWEIGNCYDWILILRLDACCEKISNNMDLSYWMDWKSANMLGCPAPYQPTPSSTHITALTSSGCLRTKSPWPASPSPLPLTFSSSYTSARTSHTLMTPTMKPSSPTRSSRSLPRSHMKGGSKYVSALDDSEGNCDHYSTTRWRRNAW